jgi:IS1 family transposase
MNSLTFDKKVRVVSALVKGVSIRATERLTDVARNTIGRINLDVGEGCRRLHNAMFRGLQVNVLEVDEIWAFIAKKQRRLTDRDPPERGDCYTFLGIDANRKAIISFAVGKRDSLTTADFITDLRDRITNKPQISTDGFAPYVEAIKAAFGEDADYAQIIKQYGSLDATDERRYSPPKCTSSTKRPISGTPDPDRISTSYVERQNLTVRMQVRRFTRLTNAFSKRMRNHAAAVALYVGWYNFCRAHETLRVTPAMALDVTDHVWSVAELIDAALAIAPEDAPRLPAHATPPPVPEGAPLPEVDPRQMSLLDWQPRPLRPPRPTVDMEQIDLFSLVAMPQE